MSDQPLSQVQALTFDVFGTVVDWRSSIEAALRDAFRRKTALASFSLLSPDLQQRVLALAHSNANEEVSRFAQEWRRSYGAFTHGFVPGRTPWKDIDTHHYDSLLEQLARWQLAGVFTDDEARALSLAWHRLEPWADAPEGLHRLGASGRFATATLSNGNRALLQDLDRHGRLGFAHIISAEDFGAYKPNAAVYLGAAAKLGLPPRAVAMVAAHLGDLWAARQHGLHTIYVERPQEEDWPEDDERRQTARDWVDIWVGQGEDGFREVARQLGM